MRLPRPRYSIRVMMIAVALSAIAIWSTFFVRAQALRANRLQRLAVARTKAAKARETVAWAFYQNGTILTEPYYQASVQFMESECDEASNSAARVAARIAHLSRMRRLVADQELRSGYSHGINFPDLKAAEYYLAEAEYWLAREQ